MPEFNPTEIAAWARKRWPGGDPGPLQPEPVAADGSARLFARLASGANSLVAMSNPDNPAENRAWSYLAGHLRNLGLPVARVLTADLEQGLFLMEDLGRGSLQDAVLAASGQEEIAGLYEPVLAMLVRLQAKGARDFDASICFDSRELSPEFLLQREAGYFINEFILGACGFSPDQLPVDLERDMAGLCQKAGGARPKGLVHRDFQSRNIIYEAGRLGLVDFQGARLGPAQYDLASLLHDPYVDLPMELRQGLKSRYMELQAGEGPFDPDEFQEGWPFVSASRVMQALGAYAFLTRRKRRAHFARYVSPALATLRALCQGSAFKGLDGFRRLIDSLPRELDQEALTPLNEENQ